MTGSAEGRDTRARWDLVHAVLADALELTPDERAEYLDRRCGGDPVLRREVDSLLEASAASDAYFDDLADRAGISRSDQERDGDGGEGALEGDPLPELIGTEIGQYRVLRWLGRGGMASVYLAERRGEGFTQRVALKLVPKPLTDERAAGRATEERAILARLEHRGIARLIDGGVSTEGYPFYTMEYVEGSDILTYCDTRRLRVKQRLQLFLDVCAPVQFAHARLVVHCDLKPGNIFVTDDGHVKLLDFGVARLIDPDAEGDEVTGLWFTPAYASPEQVRREPPAAASDVYSLGVLLYEMLSGQRPYRFPGGDPDDIVRMVGEVTPPIPSSVVVGAAAGRGGEETSAAEVAAARRSTPARMRKRLKGDLDSIVMTALAKNPAERFHTVEQLASEIRRHLEHRSLRGVPQTRRERAAKFVRRYRSGVAAAFLVTLAVAGGLGSTLWQAARAREAAALARAEADKAALVAGLMTDLFRLGDPNEVLGDTITARDLLDRGTARIQEQLVDQPIVQAELLSEIARVYRNLGLYRRAEPLARQALDLRVDHLGAETLEASESLARLGVVLADLGRQTEAIETLDRAIRTRESLLASPDSTLVAAQAALAWLTRDAQQHERAVQLFRAALEGERALDPDGPGVTDMQFGLAATFHDSGMLDEADSLLRAGLADLGPESRPTPGALGALRTIGMIRRVREQYRDAEPLLRAAVRMAERLYGPTHPDVFDARAELGHALRGVGAWDEAEQILRETIQGSSSLLGPSHRTTAGLQEALAGVLIDQQEYGEAAHLGELALQERIERHQGEDHPGVVASLVRVAEALVGDARYDEAGRYLKDGAAMSLRLSPSSSVYEISMERSRAHIAVSEDDTARAEAHFLRAIELAEELLNRPDHRYTVRAKRDYAAFLAEVGRRTEARTLYRWVLQAQIDNLGEPHPDIDRTRAVLGSLGG